MRVLARGLLFLLVAALDVGAAAARHRVIYTFDEPGWQTFGSAAIAAGVLTIEGKGAEDLVQFAALAPAEHRTGGVSYSVRAKVNADEAIDGTPLRVFLTTGIGFYFDGRVLRTAVPPGFHWVDVGTFTVDPDLADLFLGVALYNGDIPPALPALGTWKVDGIEIEELLWTPRDSVAGAWTAPAGAPDIWTPRITPVDSWD